MKRLFPLSAPQTLITHLFSPRSPQEEIAEASCAAADGADAIAVELQSMPEEYRTEEAFRQIIQAVPLPFMFILYRSDRLGWPDEKRQETLMTAVQSGAGMIDIPGDLYDKSPDERTRNPEAIRRQMKMIEEVHAAGSQVIMSSHPLRTMTSDEITDQLKDFEQRGADVVKLVATADTPEQFSESIQTTIRLNRELKTPFVHLCGGSFGRIQRMTGLSLGVAITFGVHAYHDFTTYMQPTIREFRAVRDCVRWNIKDVLKEER